MDFTQEQRKEFFVKMKSICLIGTIFAMSELASTCQATLSLTIAGTSNSSASVVYSGNNIYFTNGLNATTGEVVSYAANSLNSSASFTVTGGDGSGTFPSIQRLVEEFTNNTGRSLSGLTITLSGAQTPEFIPQINSSFPAYVTVTSGGTYSETVTNTIPQGGTFAYGTNNTSITFKFNNILANGATFNYYVPLVTNSANSQGGSGTYPGTLTLSETAIPTPEPSTIMSAFCGALGLAGFAASRKFVRGRKLTDSPA